MLAMIVKLLIANLVIALMLSTGLAAKPRGLAEIWRRPALYVRALLVLELGVPLLAMLIVSALALPPIATGIILVMAICPGAPFIPTATRAKGESISVVGLNLLVIASVLAPLSIPAWIAILDRVYLAELQITPAQVFGRVLLVVFVPLVAGMAIRHLLPRAAAVLARALHHVFLVSLVGALAALAYLGAPVFLEVPPIVLLGVVLVVLGSAAMGVWAAVPQPRATHTVAVAAVLGNPGLALAIIAASFPGVRAGALIAAYLILRKLVLLPIEIWIKRRRIPTAPLPSLDEPHAVGAS
jgi:bile acid:Na+ symporter, BASS family